MTLLGLHGIEVIALVAIIWRHVWTSTLFRGEKSMSSGRSKYGDMITLILLSVYSHNDIDQNSKTCSYIAEPYQCNNSHYIKCQHWEEVVLLSRNTRDFAISLCLIFSYPILLTFSELRRSSDIPTHNSTDIQTNMNQSPPYHTLLDSCPEQRFT